MCLLAVKPASLTFIRDENDDDHHDDDDDDDDDGLAAYSQIHLSQEVRQVKTGTMAVLHYK